MKKLITIILIFVTTQVYATPEDLGNCICKLITFQKQLQQMLKEDLAFEKAKENAVQEFLASENQKVYHLKDAQNPLYTQKQINSYVLTQEAIDNNCMPGYYVVENNSNKGTNT